MSRFLAWLRAYRLKRLMILRARVQGRIEAKRKCRVVDAEDWGMVYELDESIRQLKEQMK